jgi:hypothetical protein
VGSPEGSKLVIFYIEMTEDFADKAVDHTQTYDMLALQHSAVLHLSSSAAFPSSAFSLTHSVSFSSFISVVTCAARLSASATSCRSWSILHKQQAAHG